jgi:PPK2 family polyphosphate:nucleotide phosphotransferase
MKRLPVHWGIVTRGYPKMEIERFRVPPGGPVDLTTWPTDDDGGWDRRDARQRTEALNRELEDLQELLYAEGRHKVLVVIQATDTGGKDGTIRHVFDGVNPQGVKVATFKKPTESELAHDFLWRVHAHTPSAGEITIFNRSHYEDVLVVRVHELVPRSRWERRYRHINAFEQMLVDEGTTIVKLFLHISKEEQRERLQSRLDEPHKRWKFSLGDLAEREHWDEYQAAFVAALEHTSTARAPWYVIPADRKWFRNLVVSEIMVQALQNLEMSWPQPEDDIDGVVVT